MAAEVQAHNLVDDVCMLQKPTNTIKRTQFFTIDMSSYCLYIHISTPVLDMSTKNG